MYYPKSQIQVNLYTNGGELSIKSNNQNYIGSYWKTSDGKFFTGKTPDDSNIQELIKTSTTTSQTYSNLTAEAFEPTPQLFLNPNSQILSEYSKLNSKFNESKKLPKSYNPSPTESDYELGEFSRYFCKKTNEIVYTEINKETYTKLSGRDSSYLWQLYIPIKYSWSIAGDEEKIYNINKNMTKYMMNKFKLPALDKFLREDYLKFWKA
jgi:hypothetical protein